MSFTLHTLSGRTPVPASQTPDEQDFACRCNTLTLPPSTLLRTRGEICLTLRLAGSPAHLSVALLLEEKQHVRSETDG
ncbi:hypothetical protein CSOJ01_07272 [Colletotrichum sojae]|uniref:Uncharacterized protein n=1 Tax=Colletotrichum sojae TaxID=2175907 RepID=A0A8H6MUN1_9PEZI|nr:hypothetical protein CSOJ01_07272 [Colletotrichum sojae]